MKIKKTLLVFMLVQLFVSYAFSQNNVGAYYELINKAELCITEDNLSNAFALYDEAFTKIKSPFYTDLHNAFICGYYSHEPEDKLINIAKLLYNKTNGSTNFIDSAKRDNRYERIIKAITGTPITLNLKLVSELDSLQKEDQNARKKCGYRPHCAGDVRAVDSTNRIKLISMYEEYGKITEDNAGYKVNDRLFILGLHNQMWCHDVITSFVEPLVHKGLYDAREYLKILDRQKDQPQCNFNSRNFGYDDYLLYDTVLFVSGMESEQKLIINENRKQYYLEDKDELIKKTIYKLAHSEFKIGVKISRWVMDKDEQENYIKTTFEKIESGAIVGTEYFFLKKL